MGGSHQRHMSAAEERAAMIMTAEVRSDGRDSPQDGPCWPSKGTGSLQLLENGQTQCGWQCLPFKPILALRLGTQGVHGPLAYLSTLLPTSFTSRALL